MTTERPPQRPEPTPREQALRSLQALVGVVAAGAGVAFYDPRAGLIAFGSLLLLTSGIWRAPR
jgi:hypothetical protein